MTKNPIQFPLPSSTAPNKLCTKLRMWPFSQTNSPVGGKTAPTSRMLIPPLELCTLVSVIPHCKPMETCITCRSLEIVFVHSINRLIHSHEFIETLLEIHWGMDGVMQVDLHRRKRYRYTRVPNFVDVSDPSNSLHVMLPSHDGVR